MKPKRVTLTTFEIKDGHKAIDFLIALGEFAGGQPPTLEIDTARSVAIIKVFVDEDCLVGARDFKIGYFRALATTQS